MKLRLLPGRLMAYLAARRLRRLHPAGRAEAIIDLVRSSADGTSPREDLEFLLQLENRLYTLEGMASVAYGDGIHTKHRHMDYHRFFIRNLKAGERVLDIGCGNGLLSYDMVTQAGVKVVGIELSEGNIRFACEHYRHPDLEFVHGDALQILPNETFDVVTLSNVLEHIERRVGFLKQILAQIKPGRMILRVPLFERDWRVPLKKELGIDYRLDATHFVEYTQEDFVQELRQAGLRPSHLEIRWGEIWCVAKPESKGVTVDG